MKHKIFKEAGEHIELRGNLPFILLHVGCLLVFWAGFSWAAFGIFILTLLPRMFALTAGYHRYFSHRSDETSRLFQFILAFVGAMAFQKDAMWWAAHHRHHHRHADTERDSHPPGIRGFFWAHMGWLMCKKNAQMDPTGHVPDLAKYPELVWLHRYQKIPYLIYFLTVIGLGTWIQYGLPQANTTRLQVIVWGFFISTVFLHHATFTVNSLTHMFGARRFKTKDGSRNNWFVALITMGEGWHNNHHRYPSSERQGFYWWELDLTHLLLKVLSLCGIVWNLRQPPKEIYQEARYGQKQKAA